MNKTISMKDILSTDKLLNEAIRLYEKHRGSELHRELTKLIEPEMPAINKRLGQENDVGYMAYAVGHALMKSSK